MNRIYIRAVALVAVVAFLLTGAMLVQAAPLNQDEGNVLAVIQGNEDLATLAAAIEAASLGETLAGEGPFTVFAPNNAAFEAIPAEDLEALLADTAALTDILLLHVVGGELMAADLGGEAPVSALGDPLDVVIDGDSVTINGAAVVSADIAASNGVVHVIDSVLVAAASEEAAADEAAEGGEEAAEEAAAGEEAGAEEAGEEAVEEPGAEEPAEEGSEVAEEAADGSEAASEEAGPAQDAAPAQMDQPEEGEEANIAERSGRPRSEYKKVWKGVNKPRSMWH
jgi:uncharacterized surface protein with fasciclin (FAS1) repeats